MRRRLVGRALLAAIALVIAVPPLIVALTPDRGTPVTVPPIAADTFHVWVAEWDYHTSILLEQPPGWRLGPPREGDAPVVEYAWGDRRFYMESNYRPVALFATVFLPTASVTYVEGWRDTPERAARPRALYVRRVTGAQMRALVAALERTIVRAPDGARGAPYPPATGYAGRFYPAHGAYLWSSDCNRWVVERLRAAGLARSARGVIVAPQVPARLIGFHEVPVTPP